MGKQVGFFMTFADEMAFLSALRDEFGAISVVANSSKTERKIITQLTPVNCFNANISLMRSEDVDDIVSTYIV